MLLKEDAMGYKHFDLDNMRPLFSLLERCKLTEQAQEHHPEGNVYIHSLQTLKCALRESSDIDLLLAALLHDIGKYENSLGHSKIACKWLTAHCSVKTLWFIEHHMRVWDFILGDMRRYAKVQYLANHPWLPELVQLARWDKMGRNPNAKVSYTRQDIVDILNNKVDDRWEAPK
jgi:predicted HD phosphohydrolase